MKHEVSDTPARAWILNLDAELELMRPNNYHPTKGSLVACERFASQARRLVQAYDRELVRTPELVPGCAQGYQGAAWCPTPSIVALLDRAGAPIEYAPSLGCLQTVNHRRFHAELGQTLPEATFLTREDEVVARLAQPSPDGWMVKRGFGFAGRGVRRMPSVLTPDDARWLTHALAYGGVQVEPWVHIIAEYSMHGFIAPTGVRLGEPCVLLAWSEPTYELVERDATGAKALEPVERRALIEHVELTARALRTEGYLGPFGIDAFTYRWQGTRHFNPRSEVNARYTLAYAVGMRCDPS